MEIFYRCDDCKAVFGEHEAGTVREMHTEVSEFGQAPIEEAMCCPCCGSTALIKTSRCKLCGEILEEDEQDYCDKCRMEVVRQYERYIELPMETKYGISSADIKDAICEILF